MSEIGRYTEDARIETPRSGNRVDRCPVGARTAAEGQFRVRPWERKRVETVDSIDSVGAEIAIKYAGGERQRVRPKRSERGESVGDKSRFGYDGRRNGRRLKVYKSVAGGASIGEKSACDSRTNVATRGAEPNGRVRHTVSEVSNAQEAVESKESFGSTLVSRRGETPKRIVGTGVDRERRYERKKEERKGERELEARGVGQRGNRRRHSGETVRKGKVVKEQEGARLSVGRNRGKERPVLRTVRNDTRIGKVQESDRGSCNRGQGGLYEEKEKKMWTDQSREEREGRRKKWKGETEKSK